MGDLSPSRVARKLVLASSSPRRREQLQESGYVFEIQIPGVDETALPGEAPQAMAERLACAKADEIAASLGWDVCVLAADTVVVLGDRVYGKPADQRESIAMLLSLAGKTHEVLTGYCLQTGRADSSRPEKRRSGVSRSRVEMRAIEPEEAEAYAAGGEPLDKAGGYAVQGEGGSFVVAIEGLRSNVIGLPLETVIPLLSQFGVEPA